jgi:hypothetical protein
MVAREQQRWARMAAESAAEEERLAQARASGMRAKRNMGSEHFNIITLAYHSTPQGQNLRYKVCCVCVFWGGGEL